MNVRLLIEYDGTLYQGWQRQPHRPTIQGELETIIRKITGEQNSVCGAGRTDSGVHALGQVANFHTETQHPAKEWRRILNFHLPPTIRVLESAEAPADFHAQKKAIQKTYEYRILNRISASAISPQSLHVPRKLDWKAMRAAVPYFIGTHDFRSFQGARSSVKTTVRTIQDLAIYHRGDGHYAIRVQGNGFLKQMVRAIAGTLIQVGEGKIAPEDVKNMIASCDRRAGGPTAPANGLFLVKVIYPDWTVS